MKGRLLDRLIGKCMITTTRGVHYILLMNMSFYLIFGQREMVEFSRTRNSKKGIIMEFPKIGV